MKLKKILTVICVSSVFLSLAASPAFARSNNHVNKQVNLLKNRAPSPANSSTLYLEAEDYPGTGDIQFKVLLDGPGSWLYTETHSLTTGLTIYTISEEEISVTATEEYMLNNERIAVPLFIKATGYGYISAVVDPLDTILSAGTYRFASCGSGSVYIEAGQRNTVSGDTVIKGTVIKDTGALPIEAGTKFSLSLNNGYSFQTSGLKVSYSGKFTSENTKLTVNEENPSEATIEVLSATPNKTGAILIDSAYITKGSATSRGSVELTLKNGVDERVCTVALYDPDSETAQRNAITLIFTIGHRDFQKAGETIETDAAPYINEDNYTMLPLRAAAEAFGINDVTWDSEAKAISMTNEAGQKIRLTIGNKEIQVGNEVVTADTAAQITDGRTFVPLRALAKVLGVPNENITYTNRTKTVTIIKE